LASAQISTLGFVLSLDVLQSVAFTVAVCAICAADYLIPTLSAIALAAINTLILSWFCSGGLVSHYVIRLILQTPVNAH
jgi:hypothetical protein